MSARQWGFWVYLRHEPRLHRTRGWFLGTNLILRRGDPLEIRLPATQREESVAVEIGRLKHALSSAQAAREEAERQAKAAWDAADMSLEDWDTWHERLYAAEQLVERYTEGGARMIGHYCVVHTPLQPLRGVVVDEVDGVYGPFERDEAIAEAKRMNEVEYGVASVWTLDGYPSR